MKPLADADAFNPIGWIERRSLRSLIAAYAAQQGTPFATAVKELILRADELTDGQRLPGIIRVPAWMVPEWHGFATCDFGTTRRIVGGFSRAIDPCLQWLRSPLRLRVLNVHTLQSRNGEKPPAPPFLPDRSTPGWPNKPAFYLGIGFVYPLFLDRVEGRDWFPYSTFYSRPDEEPLLLMPRKHWASESRARVA